MKPIGVFLLPSGWDASSLQGSPPPPPSIEFANTHLYTWNVTDQGLNPDRSIGSRAQLTMRPGHSASPNPQLSFANIDIVARVRFECKKLKRKQNAHQCSSQGKSYRLQTCNKYCFKPKRTQLQFTKRKFFIREFLSKKTFELFGL